MQNSVSSPNLLIDDFAKSKSCEPKNNSAKIKLWQDLKQSRILPQGISTVSLDDQLIHLKLESVNFPSSESTQSGEDVDVLLTVPDSYPESPPKVCFKAKLEHPLIDEQGNLDAHYNKN